MAVMRQRASAGEQPELALHVAIRITELDPLARYRCEVNSDEPGTPQDHEGLTAIQLFMATASKCGHIQRERAVSIRKHIEIF